jgi:uncharacterized protein (DUF305 family)
MSSSPSAGQAEQGAEFNEADVMFAQTMIPHHEQAIEMSELILAKDDVDPAVADIATRVKEAQGPEIAQLEQWLGDWGADRASEHAGHGGMEGMMSQDDMQQLADADGAEAGPLFLEQMIVHHRGAVDMAQRELEEGRAEGAVEMARAITDTQTAEIQEMEELLASM